MNRIFKISTSTLSILTLTDLFQVTSVACLSSLVTSGTAKVGVSALPHFAKLRLLLFVSLAGALFSLLVIFLNISHLHALIPMDYSKMVNNGHNPSPVSPTHSIHKAKVLNFKYNA